MDLALSNLENFPTEMVEQIFSYLDMHDLLTLRLMSKRIFSIISGSLKLRNILEINFPENEVMDENYVPKNLPLVGKAIFRGVDIMYAGPWWCDSFGATLTDLTIFGDNASLPALLTMLWHTPNLNRFELRTSIELTTDLWGYTPRATFLLEYLEHLILITDANDAMLDLFKVIGAYLKSVKVKLECGTKSLVDFVEALQDTLEAIEIHSTDSETLLEIASMRFLKLKHFRLHVDQDMLLNEEYAEQLLEICRRQAKIESLKFRIKNDIDDDFEEIGIQLLNQICSKLPKLKQLQLYMYPAEDSMIEPIFLDSAPNLERLTIVSTYREIKFDGYRNPALKMLNLSSLRPICLQEYLEQSPHLQSLTMSGVFYDTEISPSERFPLLRHWWSVPLGYNAERDCKFKQLKVLKLCAEVGTEAATSLIALCHLVEEVHIHGKREQVEAMAYLVCLRLRLLKKLTLSELTETIVDAIMTKCNALEKLIVHYWTEVSDESRQLLRDKGIRVLLDEFCSLAYFPTE